MQEVNVTVTRILPNQHMNLYNTIVTLSCPKQTPILRMVTPNSVRTQEETDHTKEVLAVNAAAIAMAIKETTHLLVIHS